MFPQKTSYTIAVLVGSLRKESLSLKLAHGLRSLAPARLQLTLISLAQLPLYNEDLETSPPPQAWQSFRRSIKSVDGVLFITPEYNRSVPAVLKNAIDVGSAPHGQNVFAAKPAAIISLSPGKMGAFGANHHLRQSLVFLNMPTMQQPEAYISNSADLFDQSGEICQENTRHYLQTVLEAFAEWVEKHTPSIM